MVKKIYKSLINSSESEELALRRLIEIVKILRKECPWDKEQTHESLEPCMIEEAYEAVEAIRNEDYGNLREELGDVLLQVVFHGLLGEEMNNFTLLSIINGECEKMVNRHPHVFSETKINTIDKTLEKWENMKQEEQGNISCTEQMEKVPKVLPALLRSYKVQNKAANVGFDWKDVYPAFLKIKEETDELYEAYENRDRRNISEELGDLLFAVVNAARFLDVNPEVSLEAATRKFVRRFSFIEKTAEAEGKALTDMCLSEMDELWNQAKQQEVSNK